MKALKVWRSAILTQIYTADPKPKRICRMTIALQRSLGLNLYSRCSYPLPLCLRGNWNSEQISSSLRWCSKSGVQVDSNPCLPNSRVWPAFSVGLCSSLSQNNVLPNLCSGTSFSRSSIYCIFFEYLQCWQIFFFWIFILSLKTPKICLKLDKTNLFQKWVYCSETAVSVYLCACVWPLKCS